MTLYKPTLQLVRLRVMQGGHIAYEGEFHNGVNIVRGMNSAGNCFGPGNWANATLTGGPDSQAHPSR